MITVDGQVGGKEKPKFDKKKFKPTNIKIDTTTTDADNPDGLPPKVYQSVVEVRPEEHQVQPQRSPRL